MFQSDQGSRIRKKDRGAGADMQIIRQHDLVETPWKNGGGITRNIAQEGDTSGPLWRLSMADVDRNGEFSSFPGMTRILTVIKGDNMMLHRPNGAMLARYAVPMTFDGSTPITATLGQGPIRNFNLMFDTAQCVGKARVVREPGVTDFGRADQTGVLHVIAGHAQVEGAVLDMGDTVISTAMPISFDLPDDAAALIITLRAKD